MHLTVRSLPLDIRRTEAPDRDPILAFLEASGFFRPEEIAIAREVLDEAVAKGPTGHYQSFTAETDAKAVGWVCFGRTPCTVSTFDIYWVATVSAYRGKGVGKALMAHAEKLILQNGGKLVIVETSGQALYQFTRGFYVRLGYTEQARVPDFYAAGDDKIIYARRLGEGG